MRFIDEAVIALKAGKGGHGCISFRREKFIPRGGPNGGDGGDGGSVILRASPRMLSLYDFRLKRHYEAENGQPGMGSQMHGRGGQDLYLDLPVGTLVFAFDGALNFDPARDGHMHDATVTFVGTNEIRSRWTFWSAPVCRSTDCTARAGMRSPPPTP